MKQINIIITLLLVLSLFSSCQDDFLYDMDEAMLSIKLSTLNNAVATRLVSSADDEKKVFNAYVFIFDSSGEKVYSKFYTGIDKSGRILIDDIENILGTDEKMTVAVIANIDEANKIMNTSRYTLKNITTKEALKNYVSIITGDYVERGTSFLMSGIDEEVSLLEPNNAVSIPLVRIDAKIRFNIKTHDDLTKVVFTPSEWRVVSLPKKVYVFPSDRKNNFPIDTAYFTTEWKNYEPVSPESSAAGVKATFAFYSLESMLNAKKAIPRDTSGIKPYSLRDKQLKKGDGTNIAEFEYANDAGTYVELKGNIAYTDVELPTSADVKFMIHLGGGVGDVDNYSTVRNTSYTYNIMIQSVNDIIVEVNSGNEVAENRPGAEGDVILANVTKEFDAYNNVSFMTFAEASIDESLTWDVSTPFSKGEAGSGVVDYKWVYFRLENKDAAGEYDTTSFKTYLGDQNVYLDDIENNEQASTFLDQYIGHIGTENEKMLNVDQLVEVLKECKRRKGASNHQFDTRGVIVWTMFVQDYYYESNPNNLPEIASISLWKDFVNTDKRVLNISSEYQVSADGKSTKSEAVYSIRQASIQTMYSTNMTDNIAAFGSQFYPNEAANKEFVQSGETTAINHKANGRKNFAGFFGVGSRWDNYIDPLTWKLRSDYDYAKYKSLLHNRDMNGDGIIDKEEIQWYLASIDQLSILWIGEEALHPTSKLYQFPDYKANRQHYVSSSVLFAASDPEILWAAEGSSVGRLNDQWAKDREVLYYRTVRNLGIPKTASLDAMPDSLYRYVAPYATQQTTHDGSVDLSRLNSKALRGFFTEAELPDHGIRDGRGYNKPYKKFAIKYAHSTEASLTWEQVRERSQPNGTNPVAPVGWRVPNQRELSIMYIVMKDFNKDGKSFDAWPHANHFSRTGFNTVWSRRPGFAVNQSTLFLLSGPETGGVRCVKDIE